MLLAFGLTETAYNRLPRGERQEMWAFWQWRHELTSQLKEKERMEQQAAGRGVSM